MIFFAPGAVVDPPLAPAVRRLCCSPAIPSDQLYGCRGVRLGDSEGWKPKIVGACGRTRCRRKRILSHVSQGTARVWFRGVGAHCADLEAFWRLFGLFLRHIVELKGTSGRLDTVKSSRTWAIATVSLRLSVSPRFGGYFGRKMAVFGPKLRRFGRAPLNLAPPPRAATGAFWLKTWIWQGHHLGSKMATWAKDPMRCDAAMAKTARKCACCCCLRLVVT